ncbi:MAG: hypothetical protein Q9180_009262, partial [Flavoplaca navasiana]
YYYSSTGRVGGKRHSLEDLFLYSVSQVRIDRDGHNAQCEDLDAHCRDLGALKIYNLVGCVIELD